MDGNENNYNVSNSNGNSNHITDMSEWYVSSNNYTNIHKNCVVSNISSIVDNCAAKPVVIQIMRKIILT